MNIFERFEFLASSEPAPSSTIGVGMYYFFQLFLYFITTSALKYQLVRFARKSTKTRKLKNRNLIRKLVCYGFLILSSLKLIRILYWIIIIYQKKADNFLFQICSKVLVIPSFKSSLFYYNFSRYGSFKFQILASKAKTNCITFFIVKNNPW